MTCEILFKFVEKDINLSPGAYKKILALEDPLDFSSSLIVKLKSQKFSKNDLISLNESTVDEFIKTLGLNIPEEDDEKSISNPKNKLDDKNFKSKEKNIDIENENLFISKSTKSTELNNDNKENSLNSTSSKNMINPKNSSNYNDVKLATNEDLNYNTLTIEDNSKNIFISKETKRNLNETDVDFDFKIIQDTSKKSYTSGEISNLITYFNNRYEKISNILIKRPELKKHQKIADITDDLLNIAIIGIIKEIRNTKNNHKIIEIEDDTGEISVLFHKDNHGLFKDSEKLVRDEVIGLLAENKGNLIIASRIIHPGVQRIPEKNMDFAAVFTSDIHIGSLTFLEDAFVRFIKWINGDFGNDSQKEIANDVKYLIIAGDIVDGIGVYPNQDKELAIKDIKSQYDEAARLLGEIRSDIKIIIGPGNHDASRVAEPQPAVPEEYAKSLYELNNVEFISNPGVVSLDGINTLIYHGRGFDDIAMTVKGMSHEKNDLMMEELLKKRHLAPIYGERTPLASELEDHLVIDNIPDIFHTGHVHINTYKKYNGVHMINSGTFQTQTEFQKIYNIVPTCAEVPVLHKGIYKQLKFI